MFRRQKAATPPPEPESTFRRQMNNIVETQLTRFPFLVQMRALWRQLQDERESWPILLPVLLILFIGFYRSERAKVRALIRDIQD
ncbi:MAG: hypothetical protein HC822_09350 [Oscillochloris sp.]|nr:hypothetical protein [Oscillochloris sp.]